LFISLSIYQASNKQQATSNKQQAGKQRVRKRQTEGAKEKMHKA
jgi:hypothetical protein